MSGKDTGKTLADRVAASVSNRKTPARSVNRGVVLAHKVAIREALDAGFSVNDVWETLRSEGVVNCSYKVFREHVNQSVLDRQKSIEPPSAPPQKPPTKPSGLASFTFNPKPNKEDLL